MYSKGEKRTKEFIEDSKAFGKEQANFVANVPDGMKKTPAGKKIKKNKVLSKINIGSSGSKTWYI